MNSPEVQAQLASFHAPANEPPEGYAPANSQPEPPTPGTEPEQVPAEQEAP